jgi:hypothetical protein
MLPTLNAMLDQEGPGVYVWEGGGKRDSLVQAWLEAAERAEHTH